MYFIYIMYSERAKSKIVCEETIPFWELECHKYLSYECLENSKKTIVSSLE